MVRLIRAEFLKLRTTQVWFWLLLGVVAVTVLIDVANLAPSTSNFQDSADVANVFTAAGTAYVVVFVLGVLGVTTEFRYQTFTPTVLTTPSRWAIVTAKMITYALVGAVYAALCLLVQVVVVLPWVASKGLHVGLGSPHIGRALVAVFVVVTLFGIIGLGFGALVRNQIVAVSVGVVFLLVINNILPAIPGVKHVYPYTPGGAANALFVITDSRDINGVSLVSPIAGAIVLALWAFVPAIIGAAVSLNRDIT